MLVTSNFSFSHKVFKSCLLLMRQNEYLWSKGLTLSHTIPTFINDPEKESFGKTLLGKEKMVVTKTFHCFSVLPIKIPTFMKDPEKEGF